MSNHDKENYGPMNMINDFFQQKPNQSLLHTLDQFFHPHHRSHQIPIKIMETDSRFTVKAQLPGISKEDIDVEVLKNMIRIKVNERDNEIRRMRSIKLPYDVSTAKMKARHKDGILEITFPKKKGKKIEIE